MRLRSELWASLPACLLLVTQAGTTCDLEVLQCDVHDPQSVSQMVLELEGRTEELHTAVMPSCCAPGKVGCRPQVAGRPQRCTAKALSQAMLRAMLHLLNACRMAQARPAGQALLRCWLACLAGCWAARYMHAWCCSWGPAPPSTASTGSSSRARACV